MKRIMGVDYGDARTGKNRMVELIAGGKEAAVVFESKSLAGYLFRQRCDYPGAIRKELG